ncbi:unnamed protein product [Brachionus calyciflorus]|uniref:Derlin n=1 Tax=Brachionus calyciflorus TaxID=104777 RepID=A0A813XCP4_9BILA|nr:unnamed protein product [Brachionus calyciflorus]
MIKSILNLILIISISAVIAEKTNNNQTIDDIFYFTVNHTNTKNPCLMARFSASFLISYSANINQTTTLQNVRVNLTKLEDFYGTCENTTNSLFIKFERDWTLSMTYTQDKNEYSLSNVKLSYFVDSRLFPNATEFGNQEAENNNLNEFNVNTGKSYKCYAGTNIPLGNNVTVEFKNYQAQAFIKNSDKTVTFDTAVECVGDIIGSNKLVPIVIGIVLTVLIVLVLVAYVVGRRRYRPTYQQMSSGGSDFKDWYNNIPQVTKYWFTGSVVVPLLCRFGILNPYYLILQASLFFQKFHFWRPLTALFFYPITPQSGFSYLINLYFLYSYSTLLETTTFDGRPADYLFMLIFNWIILTIIGFIASLPMLMDPMILSVMYVWCQLNRETIVSFWFGTRFKAMYLPWVLVGFNMIIRGGGFNDLIGIAVGHLYFFLMFRYPETNGMNLLKTPEVLFKYFPNRRNNVAGFGTTPRRNF